MRPKSKTATFQQRSWSSSTSWLLPPPTELPIASAASNMLAGSVPVPSPISAKKSSLAGEIGAKRGRSIPGHLNFPRRRTGRFSSASMSMSENFGRGQGSPATIGERDGLIIVDHGSRRRESNLMLNAFVAMFREKTGYPIVEPAHMELAEPSIRDAYNLCVQKGAVRVIVSPFFLFPGRHWHKDIPALTAEAAKEHPGVSYMVTAPLGLHELLVDVVNDRISHCLKRVAGEADECASCAGTGKCRLYE